MSDGDGELQKKNKKRRAARGRDMQVFYFM